jgi:hypothetical protein
MPAPEDRTAKDALGPPGAAAQKSLPEAARRALAEAAERRTEAERTRHERPREIGGPGGPEPTRYGDWEKKGLASDF